MIGKHPLLISILAALSGCGEETFEAQGCIEATEEQAMCPSGGDVSPRQVFLPGRCGDDLEVVDVKGQGELTTLTDQLGMKSTACCYTVDVVDHDENTECVVGRPYQDDGVRRRAPLRARDGSCPLLEAAEPRGTAWARAGAAEHASAAAFAKLALQLMALGAPAELVRDAHRAALDEISHAERCWSLARRSGTPVESAGPFPFAGPIDVNVDLADFAGELVRDGCLEETLGAYLAAELAVSVSEAPVREALATIASEEADHAVLAFRIVAWALGRGGPEVRASVRAALAETHLRLALGELSLRTGVEVAVLREAAERGARDVLAPARERLLVLSQAA